MIMAKRRGRCRYCGGLFGLTKGGKVYRHYTVAGKATVAETGSRIVCGGSGQLPS